MRGPRSGLDAGGAPLDAASGGSKVHVRSVARPCTHARSLARCPAGESTTDRTTERAYYWQEFSIDQRPLPRCLKRPGGLLRCLNCDDLVDDEEKKRRKKLKIRFYHHNHYRLHFRLHHAVQSIISPTGQQKHRNLSVLIIRLLNGSVFL